MGWRGEERRGAEGRYRLSRTHPHAPRASTHAYANRMQAHRKHASTQARRHAHLQARTHARAHTRTPGFCTSALLQDVTDSDTGSVPHWPPPPSSFLVSDPLSSRPRLFLHVPHPQVLPLRRRRRRRRSRLRAHHPQARPPPHHVPDHVPHRVLHHVPHHVPHGSCPCPFSHLFRIARPCRRHGHASMITSPITSFPLSHAPDHILITPLITL